MKLPQITYPAVRIEIKPSVILPGQIGVFSTRRIVKDAVIVPATHFADAELIDWSVFEGLDPVTRRKIMDYCPGTKDGFFAPPDLNYISTAWQINHSCNPNVGFNESDDFVAMRSIKRGEELCWDYAFDESNPKFRMRCHCGSVQCRSVVTGRDWQLLLNDPHCSKYFSPGLRHHIETAVQTEPARRRK